MSYGGPPHRGGRGGRWKRGGSGRGNWRQRREKRYDDFEAGLTWGGSQGGSGAIFDLPPPGSGGLSDTGERPQNRMPRHPPGLRGREIGLWYAQFSRMKKKRPDVDDDRQVVGMDVFKERHLNNLLRDIRAGESVQPQPSRSYRSPEGADSQSSKFYSDAFDDVETPGQSSQGASNFGDMRIKSESVKSEEAKFDASNIDYGGHFAPPTMLPVKRPHGILEESDNKKDVLQQTVKNDPDESPPESKRTESPLGVAVSKFSPTFTSGVDALKLEPGTSVTSSEFGATASTSTSNIMKVEVVGDVSVVSILDSDEEDDDDEDDDVEILPTPQPELITIDSDDDDDDDREAEDFSISNVYRLQHDDSEFVAALRSHNEENRRVNSNPEGATVHDVNMVRNEALDRRLLAEHAQKQCNPRFQKMQKFRQKLPSYNMQKEILRVVRENQVTVISGETGCGKTTQVAQFILDEFIEAGNGSLCRVVCTQPRRISAISVAERVADERAERCGGDSSAGYQIRLENKLPRQQGSILFCTTGILLKWLQSDPLLSKASHVVLDEIHERDLLCDFLMIILRDLVVKRPTLKLILMSATLNAEMFSEYFGGCPKLEIPGFTFPVKDYLLEDIIQLTGYRGPKNPQRPKRMFGKKKREMIEGKMELSDWVTSLPARYDHATRTRLLEMDLDEIDIDLAVCLVEHIVRNKPDGAILVFMPGWDAITKVNDMLTKNPMFRGDAFRIIPLHSMLPTVNQRQVFDRPPPGVRKIVIATNIAETSITIDDVVYVVDCGKIKMKNFDAENNLATLAPEWVSRANAKQRRGRAGRVQPGECYHMYTALQESKFKDYQLPEMLRTRLEELCLQIKLLKLGKIQPFVKKAMQPPSLEALVLSVKLLLDLNALDYNEDLTPLGYHLAQMPVDPHTGKMLLFGAMFCCLDPILTIAASLSFKDAFHIPLGKEKEADRIRVKIAAESLSDHVMLANAFWGWEEACYHGNDRQYCWDNFLSQNTLRMLRDMRKQFSQLLHDMKFLPNNNPKGDEVNLNSDNEKLIKAVICAGLYPNVAKIKKQPRPKRPANCCTATEKTVKIHPKSINTQTTHFPSPWLVYHLKMKTQAIYLYDCTMVPAYPLLFFGGEFEFRKDEGHDCIIIDDWIKFKSSRRIAHLVKELRVELDKILEYKITHPGLTNWNPREKEGAILRAIIDLITTDDTLIPRTKRE